MPQNTIHWWSSVLINKKLLKQVSQEIIINIIRFKNNELSSKSTNFEFLKGYKNLCSIRLNDESRVICTTIDRQLIILAYVPKHNYERAFRHLENGILKKFKIDEGHTLASDFEQLDESIIQPFEELSLDSDDIEEDNIDVKHIGFNQSSELQFFTLDNHQSEALNTPMPVVILGPPGSGKTTLLEELLKRALNSSEHSIAYIAVSKQLLNSVKSQCIASLGTEIANRIDFKTYAELIQLKEGEKSHSV